MSAKPLHIQVAEALGCMVEARPWVPFGVACGCPQNDHIGGMDREIARYDLEWSATGPLIERYKITLFEPSVMGYESRVDGLREAINTHPQRAQVFWTATYGYENGLAWDPSDQWERAACGPTPLVAVCHLILALHAAGKLPA